MRHGSYWSWIWRRVPKLSMPLILLKCRYLQNPQFSSRLVHILYLYLLETRTPIILTWICPLILASQMPNLLRILKKYMVKSLSSKFLRFVSSLTVSWCVSRLDIFSTTSASIALRPLDTTTASYTELGGTAHQSCLRVQNPVCSGARSHPKWRNQGCYVLGS